MDAVVKSRLFKILGIVIIILLFLVIGLRKYNSYKSNEAIKIAVEAVGVAFNASTEYAKETNRIIVKKYVKDEEELLNVTKKALPMLSAIGDYDIIELLSVRGYYDEDRNDFQFYDIYFSDIKKLEWDKINSFDDFLNQL